MKHLLVLLGLFTFVTLLHSCGGETNAPQPTQESVKPTAPVDSEVPASKRITLDDKGVGQIKDLPLPEEINQAMVAEGMALFKTNCAACHKVDQRFIGPSPKGIMERRSPEWIMNMILDPQLMVEQDRCAKDLMVEFNGAAMANQNMTVEQARSILEYFRTL